MQPGEYTSTKAELLARIEGAARGMSQLNRWGRGKPAANSEELRG